MAVHIPNMPFPGVDDVDNDNSSDVIGRKDDTVAGTSIVALIKQVLARWLVPAQNSPDNVDIGDVIGNKTDDENGNSLYAMAYLNEQHIHSRGYVWPSRAAPATLTAAAAGGGWSDPVGWVQIIPAGAITAPFDFHWCEITAASTNAHYEIDIAAGTTVITTIKFSRTNPFTSSIQRAVQCEVVPANTQIQARLISSLDGGETCGFSLSTHEY